MSRWMPAIITLAGLAAAGLAFMLFGPIPSGAIAIATLCHAAFGRSFVGDTPIPSGTTVDPNEVRQFRLAHPESTISEAAAAVAARK